MSDVEREAMTALVEFALSFFPDSKGEFLYVRMDDPRVVKWREAFLAYLDKAS